MGELLASAPQPHPHTVAPVTHKDKNEVVFQQRLQSLPPSPASVAGAFASCSGLWRLSCELDVGGS